ncbi:hypothetical protein ALC62_13160 [Cyphomyrmex costatus]|uniref:Uncharacterized protein n=1 Tax=Cyphomyrmex costatus TaxID=456900 RepID=A0A195C5I1_9HYME|nr:hypothetical protein ALC62_13160 [Cyphomyrmex costatus]
MRPYGRLISHEGCPSHERIPQPSFLLSLRHALPPPPLPPPPSSYPPPLPSLYTWLYFIESRTSIGLGYRLHACAYTCACATAIIIFK